MWTRRIGRRSIIGSFASILEAEQADIARYFNLFYNQTDGQITHSLSTNIIAPDGRVYRSYYDNDWKPADVLNDLTALAANPSQERTAISSTVCAGCKYTPQRRAMVPNQRA